MSKDTSHSDSRTIHLPTFSLLIFLFLASLSCFNLALAQEAESVPNSSLNGRGRMECPDCLNNESETSQLLQTADALYADFKPKEALDVFLKILDIDPQNQEALAKTARVYIDFGDKIPESTPDFSDKRLEQYLISEQYARKAVKANPAWAWGHFFVAASLGKISMESSVSKQIDLAHETRAEVDKAIALDPQNGFAYHILGIWNRRLAEIGLMSRFLAQTILWRSVPKGSFEKSEEYLKKALSINPDVINHHLELAKTYVAMGKWNLARRYLMSVEELPIHYSDDQNHKETARRLLQEIKDR